MTFLKCLTLLVLVAALDAAKFNCDYTFYKDARGYLKFQEMPLKFDDAKQRCALEGSILASPINDGIKAAMMDIMNTSKVDFAETPLNTAAFTGISKEYNSYGIFSSVEGIRLSDIPHTWTPGEPNNYQNKESCIAMLADGTLADVKCYKPLPHFCFLKESRAKKMNACGLKNKDYTLNTNTRSCYKYYRDRLNYDMAAATCEKEGAHLVIINGETEAREVKNLCSQIPKLQGGDYALIGFRYVNNSGEWLTLQGETIEEAGYAKWAPGEPDNHDSKEYCGAVYPSGMLNDISCDEKHTFVCEKDPEIILWK